MMCVSLSCELTTHSCASSTAAVGRTFAARAHEAHIHLPGADDAGAGRLVEQTRVSGPANPLSGAGAPQPESRKGSGLVFWACVLGDGVGVRSAHQVPKWL